MSKNKSGTSVAALIIALLLIVPIYLIAVGGVLAFLWNGVIVNALHLTTATLNLWTGVGLFVLINIIGGAFRSVQNKN